MTMLQESSSRSSHGKRITKVDIEVGQRIRARRLTLGMSQTTLGVAIGVTFQQVQKYEMGINRVGTGRLFQIAQALEVSITALVPGADAACDAQQEMFANLMNSSVAIRLMKAFGRIAEPAVRSALANLVEEMALASEK